MFPDHPPFREADDELRVTLAALGRRGGILDAKDALEEGPVRLITEPELSVNNPNNPDPPRGPSWSESGHRKPLASPCQSRPPPAPTDRGSSLVSVSPDEHESAAEPTFPLKQHLGFTIQRGAGVATARLELDERHFNPNDVAHGAVAFTLMDTAMGAAVMSVVQPGEQCATIEVHTRFHRAASSGSLRAEATVLTAGRRVVQLESRTVDDEGRLVASATGSFAVFSPRTRS